METAVHYCFTPDSDPTLAGGPPGSPAPLLRAGKPFSGARHWVTAIARTIFLPRSVSFPDSNILFISFYFNFFYEVAVAVVVVIYSLFRNDFCNDLVGGLMIGLMRGRTSYRAMMAMNMDVRRWAESGGEWGTRRWWFPWHWCNHFL